MNIAITGGGTGGHLAIAKAFVDELNNRGIKPIYIGSTYGQDKKWFAHYDGFEATYFMNTRGVVNQNIWGKLVSITLIKLATLKSLLIFRRHKITKVISVGGYSAAPASFAAILSRKEYFIHEQNSITGKLNALLKPYAKAFFSSYEAPFDDYPVRNIFFLNARERRSLHTIIFLGGSQGAKAINDLAIALAPSLHEKNIHIIHQCGKNDLQRMQKAYSELQIEVDLFDFTHSLEAKIAQADFAICRSGASTVWELAASQLPALYIPYPYAAANHQYYNAQFIIKHDASMMIEEKNLSHIQLIEEIQTLPIQKWSHNLQSLIGPNGVQKIIEFFLVTNR